MANIMLICVCVCFTRVLFVEVGESSYFDVIICR
jgi:hypothetical protein